MIEKHKPISNVFQRIEYNEKKVRQGRARLLFSNINYKDEHGAYKKFKFISDNSKHNITKWGIHSFINLPRNESLTDEQFTYVAETFLKKMGFDQAPYIVYRHLDKDEQEHIHILTMFNKFDGGKVSDSNTRLRANRIISSLEQELGLFNVSNKAVDNQIEAVRATNKSPDDIFQDRDQNGLEMLKRRKRRRIKKELQKTIHKIIKNNDNFAEIGGQLRRKGIKMMFNTNSSGICGIKFQIVANEYHQLPYHTLPAYTRGVKFSESDLEQINKQGHITVDDKQFFKTDNGLILTETEKIARDHISKKIDTGMTFKGSSLDKSFSWNKLKDRVMYMSSDAQLKMADQIHQENYGYKSFAITERKLLFAIENYNSTGIRESLAEGANFDQVSSTLPRQVRNSKYFQNTVLSLFKEQSQGEQENVYFQELLFGALQKGITASALWIFLNQQNFKIKSDQGTLLIRNESGLPVIDLNQFKYTGKYNLNDHRKSLKKANYHLSRRKEIIDDEFQLSGTEKITQSALQSASREIKLSAADHLLLRGLNTFNARLAFTALKNGADEKLVTMYNRYFPNQIEQMISANRKEYKQIQNLRSLQRSAKSFLTYFEMDIDNEFNQQR